MNSIDFPSWKQSHGQTTTQSVYLQPKHGSVTTIGIAFSTGGVDTGKMPQAATSTEDGDGIE
jgi:hypothetical protein